MTVTARCGLPIAVQTWAQNRLAVLAKPTAEFEAIFYATTVRLTPSRNPIARVPSESWRFRWQRGHSERASNLGWSPGWGVKNEGIIWPAWMCARPRA
jgi:hypothetical protein